MKTIAVEKHGLLEDFTAWGVAPNYARIFLAKCKETHGQIALEPFAFNDTAHLTNPHQWFAANAAFWCRAYREAETSKEQVETLASIRAMFFLAGMLGQSSITVLIYQWWQDTYELHGLPTLNYSAVEKAIIKHFH